MWMNSREWMNVCAWMQEYTDTFSWGFCIQIWLPSGLSVVNLICKRFYWVNSRMPPCPMLLIGDFYACNRNIGCQWKDNVNTLDVCICGVCSFSRTRRLVILVLYTVSVAVVWFGCKWCDVGCSVQNNTFINHSVIICCVAVVPCYIIIICSRNSSISLMCNQLLALRRCGDSVAV